MSDWCILRTSGRSTLPLASSLAASGYEVWTPSEGLARRRPRLDVPMTPTYVFARSRHIFELIHLSANPGSKHHGFSVFRNCHGVPLIADRSLDFLRAEEEKLERRRQDQQRKRRGKAKGSAFDIGETVRIPDGNFAGMDGIVEESDPRHTYVGLGGFMRVKVSTFILRENELSCGDNPAVGAAA